MYKLAIIFAAIVAAVNAGYGIAPAPYAVAHAPAPYAVAHAPLAVAHAPVAVAPVHAPIAYSAPIVKSVPVATSYANTYQVSYGAKPVIAAAPAAIVAKTYAAPAYVAKTYAAPAVAVAPAATYYKSAPLLAAPAYPAAYAFHH